MLARRVARLAVVLAFACVSSGCLVTTLQPIYDPASLESDDSLVGIWQGQDQGPTVVVEKGEWKSYRLTYTARSTSYALVGYLTRIDDAVFLDLTPAHGTDAGPLVVPVHGLCRLRHDGDTLTVVALDYDWFVAALKAKKLAGLDGAMDSRQNLLLTATTAAVRTWLSRNLKNAEAFREPIVFTHGK